MTSSETVRKLQLGKIFYTSIRNLPQVFKKAFIPLLIFTVPLCIGQQYFMKFASDPLAAENVRIVNTIWALVLNLFETLILYLVLPNIAFGHITGTKTDDVWTHFSKHLKHLVIEVLRGMGSIAVGLLLIIPGLRRLFQYIFIPFVVQFDRDYQQGKVDALERSKQLVTGHLWGISFIYLITGTLNMLASFLLMGSNIFVSVISWAFAVSVYIIVEILTGYAICLTYVRLQGIKEG